MSLVDLLFPKICVGCGEWGSYLCPECVNKLVVVTEPVCPICGRRNILGATHGRCKRKLGMGGLVSVLEYRGLAKKLITKLKYKLVRDLFDDLVEAVISLGDFTAIEDRQWLVAAVPLHPRRERWRGFNQAGELGKRLADYFGGESKEKRM
jgi:predicted amidophosphoribosyltransferase